MAKRSDNDENSGGNRLTGTSEGDNPDGDPPQYPSAPGSDPIAARSGVELEIVFAGRDGDDALWAWLGEHVERALVELGIAGGRLSVAIVDDVEMARLHEQYKNVTGTTDVLTFDLRDEPIELGATSDTAIDGEVVVCMDEAARQATARAHDLRVELLLYVIHGVLHLLGHDDHDPQEAAAMHAREDQVLEGIGVGTAFARREVRAQVQSPRKRKD